MFHVGPITFNGFIRSALLTHALEAPGLSWPAGAVQPGEPIDLIAVHGHAHDFLRVAGRESLDPVFLARAAPEAGPA